MTQIDDLQTRIMRALDRIGQTVDGFEPGPGGAEMDALRQQLAAAEASLAEARERAGAVADEIETAVEMARQQLEAEHEAALTAVKEQAETAQAEAVAKAESKAAEERDAAIAAIRAEAEAAIAKGGEAAPAETASPDELAMLREALEDEKLANAQLTERMRHLKEKMLAGAPVQESVAAAEGVSPETVSALDAEVQRLRAANAALAESNTALREANAMGVGDTQLINKALAAELESLRASRAVDAAEAKALIETLEPLLTVAAHEEVGT